MAQPILRYAVLYQHVVEGEYRTKTEAMTAIRSRIRTWRQRRPRRTAVELEKGKRWRFCERRTHVSYLRLEDRQSYRVYSGSWLRPEMTTVSPKVVWRIDGLGEAAERTHLFHRRKHSPAGFNWGYTGQGPADLAYAILFDAFGPNIADGHYLLFEQEHVATWGAEWVITRDQIKHWLDQQPERYTLEAQKWELIRRHMLKQQHMHAPSLKVNTGESQTMQW